MKKKIAIIVTVAALFCLFFYGADKMRGRGKPPENSTSPEKPPAAVDVFAVQKKPFKATLTLFGEVKGIAQVNLKFETPGVVSSIARREGALVKAGEIIATLDQKEAGLRARHGEIEYEDKKKLHSLGAISDSALTQARCEYELAISELKKTALAAPMDGVVGEWLVETGEYVTPNERAVTFIDTKEILVECGVIETDLPKVALGQKARIDIDAFPKTEFDGTVTLVSTVVEGRSRTAPVKIKLSNPSSHLLPGMFARAELAIYEAESAFAVPAGYFHVEEGGYFLWLAKTGEAGEFAAQKVPVEISYFSDDYLIVGEGIFEGDLIIKEVPFGLSEGERITVTQSRPSL